MADGNKAESENQKRMRIKPIGYIYKFGWR